ncbi:MAG: hypothetical protein QCI82_06015 [Candidatus Thermoplasmatota archaeon]|nr:hypothetical protein [Candidatus Thermoplasmatota archaeon]
MEDDEVLYDQRIEGSSPYMHIFNLADRFEHYRPYKCPKCGSTINSRYSRMMSTSNSFETLSGDLIIRPVEVLTCMQCSHISYEIVSTSRNS